MNFSHTTCLAHFSKIPVEHLLSHAKALPELFTRISLQMQLDTHIQWVKLILLQKTKNMQNAVQVTPPNTPPCHPKIDGFFCSEVRHQERSQSLRRLDGAAERSRHHRRAHRAEVRGPRCGVGPDGGDHGYHKGRKTVVKCRWNDTDWTETRAVPVWPEAPLLASWSQSAIRND